MRAEVAALVAAGKTREEVIEHFVAKYGSQEVLAEPIDEGFNRLAWLLPYGTGLAGVLLLATAAIRWSRRSPVAAPVEMPAVGADLQRRLDDELRDLD